MKKSKLFTKMMHVCAILTMMLIMAGCGSAEEGTNNSGDDREGFVYVPAFTEIEFEGADWFSNLAIADDTLYVSYNVYDDVNYTSETKFAKKSLSEGSQAEELPIKVIPSAEGNDVSINSTYIGEDGRVYLVACEYPKFDPNDPASYENMMQVYTIQKYGVDGTLIYSSDLTELLTRDENNSYVNNMTVDQKGRVYLASNNLVFVLDENGKELCTIDTQAEWIQSLAMDKEGKIFVSMYSMTSSGLELVQIDADAKALGIKLTGCPNANGNGMFHPGMEKGILVPATEALYEYDTVSGEKKEVLSWLSCNINGNNIDSVIAGENEKLYVFLRDYSSEETKYELAVLEKKAASEVLAKEEIVVGTLYSNQDLQSAAVAFNKKNSQYQVTLKVYIPDSAEWTETTYEDALKLMNADLTSSNCPDIIALSAFNTDNLVAKGLIEDLTPYLEKSTVVSKDDFLENVISSNTINGVLTTIPKYVQLNGILGRESQIGDIEGWTIDEFIAFTNKYPDTKIFNYVTKGSMLSIFLNYSLREFVDYNTGKCNFDSEQFIKMLEFCNRFDYEYQYNEDESFPDMVQSGEILLADGYFSSVQEYQMYSLMFPEALKVIGYPTADGEGGIKLSSYNSYAMTTKADNKDAAWQFLESMLLYEEYSEWGHSGFPVRKDMLEEMFTAAATPDYIYDENGEIVLDENGNKMENPKTSWGYDNWQADIYAATKEQIDVIRELLGKGEMTNAMDEGLFTIIEEDADPYFQGQKSAKEVAAIIQSRAQIYVDENS